MAQLPKARIVTGPDGAIKVHVSPATLYNREELQLITGEVLGRIGCIACHSGVPIAYQLEEGEQSIGGAS